MTVSELATSPSNTPGSPHRKPPANATATVIASVATAAHVS